MSTNIVESFPECRQCEVSGCFLTNDSAFGAKFAICSDGFVAFLFPDFYNITNSHGKVARFCMFKQAYRIGDDIVATCDFSESNVPCVQVSTVVSLLSLNLVLTLSSFALMGNSFLQYSVTLQSEEIVSETCRKKSSQGVTVNSYCKHNEFCLHTKKTHICLPIPLTATPGFITDVGTLCRLFVMIWLWFSFSDSAATSRFLNVLSLTICSNCKLFSESQVETALRIRHIKEATASASRADNKCRERPMAGPNSTGRGNHDLGPADQSFRNESFLCIKCITFEK